MTLAPAAVKALAAASPMPLAAPVMRTVLPMKSKGISVFDRSQEVDTGFGGFCKSKVAVDLDGGEVVVVDGAQGCEHFGKGDVARPEAAAV